MRVLVDTHAFLWFITDDTRLSARARSAIADASEAFLSLASCWEMAIKVSIGRLTLATPIDRFLPEGHPVQKRIGSEGNHGQRCIKRGEKTRVHAASVQGREYAVN